MNSRHFLKYDVADVIIKLRYFIFLKTRRVPSGDSLKTDGKVPLAILLFNRS